MKLYILQSATAEVVAQMYNELAKNKLNAKAFFVHGSKKRRLQKQIQFLNLDTFLWLGITWKE